MYGANYRPANVKPILTISYGLNKVVHSDQNPMSLGTLGIAGRRNKTFLGVSVQGVL